MSFSHYAMQKNTCFYLKNCLYLFLYCKLFMLILEPTVKRKAYQHVLYTFFPLWSLFSCTILEIIFHKHWVFILFCLTPNGNLGVCFIAQLSCASLLLVTTFLLYFEWLVLGNFYTSVLTLSCIDMSISHAKMTSSCYFGEKNIYLNLFYKQFKRSNSVNYCIEVVLFQIELFLEKCF